MQQVSYHVIECLDRYLARGGVTILKNDFERNLDAKIRDQRFRRDIVPLLPTTVNYDIDAAYTRILAALIAPMPNKVGA